MEQFSGKPGVAGNGRGVPPELGFVIDDGFVTLFWGGYPYEISIHDIDTPVKCLGWVVHLGFKNWPGMNLIRVVHLIEALEGRFGWRIRK